MQIAKAALKRRPSTQLYAVLYTPPPWMKTNNDVGVGVKEHATLKNGLEIKLAEYLWAFLEYMKRHGTPIHYLSIANEPDWGHDLPSYFLYPARFASLFRIVGQYLDKMAIRYPDVPRPKFVAPNTLSAPNAAAEYVPRLLRECREYLDVLASHDYDPRGDLLGRPAAFGSGPTTVDDGMVRAGKGYLARHDRLRRSLRCGDERRV